MKTDNIQYYVYSSEFMCSYDAKMIKKITKFFKQQFLMYPDEFLYKISIVES
jgi:hypothetical protein